MTLVEIWWFFYLSRITSFESNRKYNDCIKAKMYVYYGTGTEGSSDLLYKRVVRLTFAHRPFDHLHSRLLRNRKMDLDKTWYG